MSTQSIRVGIAPIGWTNDDLPQLGGEISFEQCIDEMALAGYEGCEVGNKYPRDPQVLKTALDERSLVVCNAWFSCYFTTGSRGETIRAFIQQRDFLHAVGARVIGASEQGGSVQGLRDMAVFERKPFFTDSQWESLCSGLNALGELAADKDMILTYHPHMGTGVQTAEEIDRLMAETDPQKVCLLYDTGHLVFSGEDHLRIVVRHGPRIRHVHLKSVRCSVLEEIRREKLSFLDGVLRGVFTVPGDGDTVFEPVFKALSRVGYRGWYVVEAEQDPAVANPLEYAKMARRYIRDAAGI